MNTYNTGVELASFSCCFHGVRRYYIEAHHIIALSQQGEDTPQNVIALCPEHHREAHYGAEAEKLEQEFLDKLKALS